MEFLDADGFEESCYPCNGLVIRSSWGAWTLFTGLARHPVSLNRVAHSFDRICLGAPLVAKNAKPLSWNSLEIGASEDEI
jgi:hypothetical protein